MLLPITDLAIGSHWVVGAGPASAHEAVDEGNAHNGGTDVVTCTNSGSLGGELKLGFQLPPANTTSLKLRIYTTTNSCDLTGTLYVDGSAYGASDVVIVPDQGGSGGWTEYTWTGVWPSMSSLAVGFKITNTFSSGNIDSVYFDPSITDPACLITYEAPEHVYLLDEPGLTSVCLDSAGSANGIYSGSMTFGASAIVNDGGTSVRFTGGKITLPASAFTSYTAFTLNAWIVWEGGVENQRLFDFNDGFGKYYYFTPNHSETGRPRFEISNGFLKIKINGLKALQTNRKTFVSCVFDGTTAYLYLNGELQDLKSTTISLASIVPSLCYIANNSFQGSIDRISTHSRSIDKSKLKAMTFCVLSVPNEGYLGLDEALILSDTVRVNVNWARGISDSINLSDNKGPVKSLTEPVSFGETLRSISRLTPNLFENLGFIDYAQVQNGLIGQRADNLIFSDEVKAYKTHILVDQLTLTDDLSQPHIKWLALQHTLTLNETLTFVVPGKFFEFITDSLSLLDSVTRTSNRYTFKDQLYIVDFVLESGIPDRVLTSEIITFSESLKTNLFVFKYTEALTLTGNARSNFTRITLTDSLNLNEKTHVSPFKIKLDSDPIILTDAVHFITNHPKLVETLSLADIVSFRLSVVSKGLNDTLTLMESLQYFPTPVRLTDTLTLTDRLNRTFPKSFTDSLALVDTARRFFGNAFVDNLTINETLLAYPSKKLNDVLLLMDILCHSYAGVRTLSDTLSLQTYVNLTLNSATTPPVIGDSGFGVASNYDLDLSDELVLAETIKSNQPPCNGGGYV